MRDAVLAASANEVLEKERNVYLAKKKIKCNDGKAMPKKETQQKKKKIKEKKKESKRKLTNTLVVKVAVGQIYAGVKIYFRLNIYIKAEIPTPVDGWRNTLMSLNIC